MLALFYALVCLAAVGGTLALIAWFGNPDKRPPAVLLLLVAAVLLSGCDPTATVRDNWPWIAPLALMLLASLITGLTPYPRARGVVTALRVLLDVFSFLTHRDSPGTLQLPLVQRSQPPAGLAMSAAGLARGAPLLVLLALLAGCPSNSNLRWSAFGADMLGCSAPAIQSVVASGVESLISLSAGAGGGDWRAIGVQLAASYGPSMALCTIGAAIKRFSGDGALPAALPPRELAALHVAVELHRNVDAWLPPPSPPRDDAAQPRDGDGPANEPQGGR